MEDNRAPPGTTAAFVSKLYLMVNDPATDQWIHWSDNGTSFLVQKPEEFARKVLPKFFKHNNFSSFVRQLNMYDFHKVSNPQQGSLYSQQGASSAWEFTHPCFRRGEPQLLPQVRRKVNQIPTTPQSSAVVLHSPDAPLVLDAQYIMNEMNNIRHYQQNIVQQMQRLESEHSVLWAECMEAKKRYAKQEQVIERMLRFLARVFSSEKLKDGLMELVIGDSSDRKFTNPADIDPCSVDAAVTPANILSAAHRTNPSDHLLEACAKRRLLLDGASAPEWKDASPLQITELAANDPLLAAPEQKTKLQEDIHGLQENIDDLSELLGLDLGKLERDVDSPVYSLHKVDKTKMDYGTDDLTLLDEDLDAIMGQP